MKYLILILILISCRQKELIESGIYYVIEPSDNSILLQHFGADEELSLNPTPILTTQQFEIVRIMEDDMGNFSIAIKLDPIGTKQFEQVTSEWIGKRLAVVIEGYVQTAPIVQGTIPNGSLQISNKNYDEETCIRLVELLN